MSQDGDYNLENLSIPEQVAHSLKSTILTEIGEITKAFLRRRRPHFNVNVLASYEYYARDSISPLGDLIDQDRALAEQMSEEENSYRSRSAWLELHIARILGNGRISDNFTSVDKRLTQYIEFELKYSLVRQGNTIEKINEYRIMDLYETDYRIGIQR